MKKLIALVCLTVLCLVVHRFAGSAEPGAADERLYVVAHVDVMPKFTMPGRELLKQFAVESRKDAGAVRIEILEEVSRPNHSTIVEVWKDRKSYDAHLEAEHTRASRTKLQPMLGSPFDERLHRLTSAEVER